MGLGTAFRAFSAALFDREKSAEIQRVLDGQPAAETTPRIPAPTPETPGVEPSQSPADRDSAITLLATLQREARLVDLIQEDLGQFSDAQVGAAARPCLQQCASTLQRLFSLEPVVAAGEGETVEVGEDASPARYQWIGEGSATSGKLVHHGWRAKQIELSTWTGDPADARVIAPAQVQR